MKSFILLTILFTNLLFSQDTVRVLHYTETTGFDHNTRNESYEMFQRISENLTSLTQYIWEITNTDESEVFDSLSNLLKYSVVIWSNTSGDAGLSEIQRNNYEEFVNSGGHYLGIHAASDTYRHSSANGNKTGTWDFYAENLAGCSIQENPNHTNQNHENLMDHIIEHPIIDNIPNPWEKIEEYYYWERGYLNTNFFPLLSVRETGNNSYDSKRMMAQFYELESGSRSFYTALGHAKTNFENPGNEFELMNQNALLWLVSPELTIDQNNNFSLDFYPNPSSGIFYLNKMKLRERVKNISIINHEGVIVKPAKIASNFIDISHLENGIYFVKIDFDNESVIRILVKKI